MSNASGPVSTAGFLLSKIGKEATERFAIKITPLSMRPKHCGLLNAVAAFPPMSQQELGRALHLVPSAIVTIIDDLIALHALRRVADPNDRRRYTIEITRQGHSLLTKVTKLAQEVDAELVVDLSETERDALYRALGKIAAVLNLFPALDGKHKNS